MRNDNWSRNRKKKKRKEETQKKTKEPVQKAQGSSARVAPKRFPPARSGDALKVSRRDGQFYVVILREMKARVNPREAGLKVLPIRMTRKKEVLLVLKKGGDVSVFKKVLDQAVGVRVNISALASKRSLEIRDLYETVRKEEVVAAPCLALGRAALDGRTSFSSRR